MAIEDKLHLRASNILCTVCFGSSFDTEFHIEVKHSHHYSPWRSSEILSVLSSLAHDYVGNLAQVMALTNLTIWEEFHPQNRSDSGTPSKSWILSFIGGEIKSHTFDPVFVQGTIRRSSSLKSARLSLTKMENKNFGLHQNRAFLSVAGQSHGNESSNIVCASSLAIAMKDHAPGGYNSLGSVEAIVMDPLQKMYVPTSWIASRFGRDCRTVTSTMGSDQLVRAQFISQGLSRDTTKRPKELVKFQISDGLASLSLVSHGSSGCSLNPDTIGAICHLGLLMVRQGIFVEVE
jgi:hypothetical protein